MIKFLKALLLPILMLSAPSVFAQTCPAPAQHMPGFANKGTGGNVFGFIAAQWDQFFAAKVDSNNGTLCNPHFVGTLTLDSSIITNALGYTPLNPALNLLELQSTPAARSNLGLGSMAIQNAGAVAITGGTITGLGTPSAPSDAATKAYVDLAAVSLVPQQAVDFTTTVVLPNSPTYANGTAGVGATLTANANNIALVVDATTVAFNNRVLVKNQADGTQNGVYFQSQVADATHPWILTRATDWDTAAEMKTDSYFFTNSGAALAKTSWFLQNAQPVTPGTTSLVFNQFSAAQNYAAGTGLGLTGNTFFINNTGVAAATYGSATQVGQFTVNAQGQLSFAQSIAIAIPATQITNGTTGTAGSPVVLGTSPVLSNDLFLNGVSGGQATYYLQNSGANVGAFYKPAGTADVRLWTSAGGDIIILPNSSPAKLRLSGNYLEFTNTACTVNSTGGPCIYADATNMVLKIGSGGGGVIVQNNAGATVLSLFSNGVVDASAGYNLAGSALARQDVNYNYIYDRSGNGAFLIGGASDARTYYRNTNHRFGGIAGSPTYLDIGAGSAQFANNVGVAGAGAPTGVVHLAIAASDTGFQGGSGALNLITGGSNKLSISNTDIQTTTNFGVGISPTLFTLQVNGSAGKTGGGTWGDSSDGRLKDNIIYKFDALSHIRQLKPTLFDWRNPGDKRPSRGTAEKPNAGGFIAQDILGVFPDFVARGDCTPDCELTKGDQVYTLSLPFKFDAYLVRALQQIDDRVLALEARLPK